MIAGGLGTIDARHEEIEFPAGTLLIQLGGARHAASAWAAAPPAPWPRARTRPSWTSIPCNRGNPEIERRAQEVINHCWAQGEQEPHPRHPTTWARAASRTPSQADELTPAAAPLRPARRAAGESGRNAKGSGPTRSQERYVLAAAPVAGPVHGLLRARALPFAVIGVATEERRLVLEDTAVAEGAQEYPWTCPWTCWASFTCTATSRACGATSPRAERGRPAAGRP